MNELKYGSVTISVADYRRMVEVERNLKDIIKDYEKRFVVFEKYVLDDLYRNYKWNISNLELEGRCIKENEYHYKELFLNLVAVGMQDTDYIRNVIYEFHERYLEETEGKEENE